MTTLRRHRLANGLSLADLAKRLGVTKGTVSTWETGRCVPKARMIPKLARVLGIDAFELTKLLSPEPEAAPAA